MKVLVVDDEKEIGAMLQDFLEAGSHKVTMAYCASQAIDEILKETPDLIILDIMMPGVTGIELLEILRKNALTSNIPVILASCAIEPDFMEKKRLGVLDFLKKPINFSQLDLLVRQLAAA